VIFYLKLNKPIHSTTNLSSYSNKQSSLQTIKQFSLTVWKKTSNANKFIGGTGYCSRREADKIIEEGRVTINGIVPELGKSLTKRTH
jgi:hypothetical protein